MLYQKVNEMEQENIWLKKRVQQLEEMLREEPSQKPYHCRECRHFIQHYIRMGYDYHMVYDGHCGAGRRTRKTVAEGKTCRYFEPVRR